MGRVRRRELRMKPKEFKDIQFRFHFIVRCHLCGGQLTRENSNVDHIKPKSKGGRNRVWNYAMAHITCNTKRGNADVSNKSARRWNGRGQIAILRHLPITVPITVPLAQE